MKEKWDMNIWRETVVTPMPPALKLIKGRSLPAGMFGVCIVWYTKKAAVEYYKQCGMKCPKLDKLEADIKSFALKE